MSYKFVSDTICNKTSQSDTFYSDTVAMDNLNAASFQVTTTSGTVSWAISVQGSNDNTTFIDTATPTPITTSSNLMFSIANVTSRYYRVAFTRTSGTLTTAVVSFVAKG